jgi:hypothetical protein
MNYGIPYMGSKSSIVESITLNFPKADHFYDLFGGGFSISHYMLLNCKHKFNHFHYNEIKADIVDLVRKAIAGDFNYDKFKPKWISREDFFANLDDPYVRICWSFGNNQKGYLFNKDLEVKKRSLHMALVFGEFDAFAKSILGFSVWPAEAKTIKQRRFYYGQKLRWLRSKSKTADGALKGLQQLQQLEQLERLEQLGRLEQLPSISMTSLDYRAVEILPNSVIYCDIPYAGTADYGAGFSHADFFDWAASRDFPVYISEYNIDDKRFKLIYDIDKRSMLSSDKSVGNKSEKLYWNGK